MSAYFSKASGTYEASTLAPVFIRKNGRRWELCVRHHEERPTALAGSANFDPVTMRATYTHRAEYVIETFPTLGDAKSAGLPFAAHPQAVAACEGFARLMARKLEGFGGHARRRRHDERIAAYVAAWRARVHADGTEVMYLAQGTEAAYVLMPARPGGDGFPYFEKAEPVSIENAARELGIELPTTPDNAGERIALGALIAELAGDDYVTTTEAGQVVAWCRDWIADTFEDAREEADTYAPDFLLKRCDVLLDGGLAFVLADVRHIAALQGLRSWTTEHLTSAMESATRNADGNAETFPRISQLQRKRAGEYRRELERRNDERQGIDRNCAACAQGLSWDGRTEHSPGCPDGPEPVEYEPVYDVARVHSGTEDGPLWYVVRCDGLNAGELVTGAGYIEEEAARMELADVRKLAKLAPS